MPVQYVFSFRISGGLTQSPNTNEVNTFSKTFKNSCAFCRVLVTDLWLAAKRLEILEAVVCVQWENQGISDRNAVLTVDNWRKVPKIKENWQKITKSDKNGRHLTKFEEIWRKNNENYGKLTKIDKNRCKLTKIVENWRELTKNGGKIVKRE